MTVIPGKHVRPPPSPGQISYIMIPIKYQRWALGEAIIQLTFGWEGDLSEPYVYLEKDVVGTSLMWGCGAGYGGYVQVHFEKTAHAGTSFFPGMQERAQTRRSTNLRCA